MYDLCFQILNYKTSRCSGVPWTLLNVSKLVLTSLLAALPTIDLIWLLVFNGRAEEEVTPAVMVASAVRILTYTAVLVLQVFCQVCGIIGHNLESLCSYIVPLQKYGQVTSGPIFIYWMTATLCMIPTFWSVVAGNQLLYNSRPVPFLTLTMQFPVIVAIFFLNFFSDAKPKYIELEGKK